MENIQIDTARMQSLEAGFQLHILLRLIHHGTQSLKALNMLVNGAGSKVTAAGQSHVCFAKPAQQCAHQIIGSTHFLDQVCIRSGKSG